MNTYKHCELTEPNKEKNEHAGYFPPYTGPQGISINVSLALTNAIVRLENFCPSIMEIFEHSARTTSKTSDPFDLSLSRRCPEGQLC